MSMFGRVKAPKGPNTPLSPEEQREQRRKQNRRQAQQAVGTGLRGIGKTAEGLFDQKADAITRAAKARAASRRRGAEQAIAADVGRSARMVRGGGRAETLADIGGKLRVEAESDMAAAVERALDTKLEKQQFMAEKYVSPAEAQQNVEAFIKSVEKQYSSVLGDDEAGLADELERYANRKDISETEREYALEQANKLRIYEKDMFASGGRGIGFV